jgi:DNA-binding SARP family transcriptional activator
MVQDHQDGPDVYMTLLGGFGLTVRGRPIALPPSAQRPLVGLALHPGDQDRTVLGAMLYPDLGRRQVLASLRTALWRAKREAGQSIVDVHGERLRLVDGADVDLRRWMRRAQSLILEPRRDPCEDTNDMIDLLSCELLPSWGETWLVVERQRWDLLRLHALECLAEWFPTRGRYIDALVAGFAALAIEPYRESAHRAIIKVHLAEGNSASALAQYHRCQRLLTRELGIRPTAQLQALVQDLTRQ